MKKLAGAAAAASLAIGLGVSAPTPAAANPILIAPIWFAVAIAGSVAGGAIIGASAAHANDWNADAAPPPGPQPGVFVTDEPTASGCYWTLRAGASRDAPRASLRLTLHRDESCARRGDRRASLLFDARAFSPSALARRIRSLLRAGDDAAGAPRADDMSSRAHDRGGSARTESHVTGMGCVDKALGRREMRLLSAATLWRAPARARRGLAQFPCGGSATPPSHCADAPCRARLVVAHRLSFHRHCGSLASRG